MKMTRLLVPFVAFLLVVSLMSGCAAPSSDRSGGDQISAGPMNEKERMKAEQWARATQGLDFETTDGLVEVEPAFPGNRANAVRYLAQGDELIAANRVMAALEQYGLAARNDPDMADAYVGMGVVLKGKGRLSHAIAAFRTAIDRDDAHVEARYQLAMALWGAAEKDEAIAEMGEILEADGGHAKAHERLAVWNYYVGDHALAWEHLRRAEALGQAVPPQLITLLEEQMPDPGAGSIDR